VKHVLFHLRQSITKYSYSKTNQTYQFLKLFILAEHSTRFGQSFCPSSGVQDCTYRNRHVSDRYGYLLAGGNEMDPSVAVSV
jgi:hypothetical protein